MKEVFRPEALTSALGPSTLKVGESLRPNSIVFMDTVPEKVSSTPAPGKPAAKEKGPSPAGTTSTGKQREVPESRALVTAQELAQATRALPILDQRVKAFEQAVKAKPLAAWNKKELLAEYYRWAEMVNTLQAQSYLERQKYQQLAEAVFTAREYAHEIREQLQAQTEWKQVNLLQPEAKSIAGIRDQTLQKRLESFVSSLGGRSLNKLSLDEITTAQKLWSLAIVDLVKATDSAEKTQSLRTATQYLAGLAKAIESHAGEITKTREQMEEFLRENKPASSFIESKPASKIDEVRPNIAGQYALPQRARPRFRQARPTERTMTEPYRPDVSEINPTSYSAPLQPIARAMVSMGSIGIDDNFIENISGQLDPLLGDGDRRVRDEAAVLRQLLNRWRIEMRQREAARVEQSEREMEEAGRKEREIFEAYKGFQLTDKELIRLQESDEAAIAWLDSQFDIIYETARRGRELSSEIFRDVERKVDDALSYYSNLIRNAQEREDIVEVRRLRRLFTRLQETFNNRLSLLIMRQAMASRNLEGIMRASQQLGARGLFEGLRLEDGKVLMMFNRFNELLEDRRLRHPNQHILSEEVYRIQDEIIKEQFDFALQGIGDYADLKTTLERIESEGGEEIEKKKEFAKSLVRSRITRAARIAYDVVVTSQREAVIVSRGKAIPAPLGYLSDPRSVLEIYNLEHLLLEKFQILNAEDEELVRRIKIDMANDHLDLIHKAHNSMSERDKEELGKQLFKDLFAVPDFFSSSWRMRGMVDAIPIRLKYLKYYKAAKDRGLDEEQAKREAESRFKSQADDPEIKEKAENLALFMRLKQASQGSEPEWQLHRGILNRRPVWEKIQRFRPEEIVRLFRERTSDDTDFQNLFLASEAFQHVIRDLKPEDKSKFDTLTSSKEKAEFIYDRVKDKYGSVIRLLRDQVLKSNAPEQIDIENLTESQRQTIDAALGNGEAEKVKAIYTAMKAFINNGVNETTRLQFKTLAEEIKELGKAMEKASEDKDVHKYERFQKEQKEKLEKLLSFEQSAMTDKIDLLLRDTRFADIYTRVLVVDDVLLDRAEMFDAGMVPVSNVYSNEQGADGLARTWNDTNAAISAGRALVKFIKTEDIKEREKAAVEFADATSNYNGQEARAKCIRFTIGTYLYLTKIPPLMNIIGIQKLPLRLPATEIEKIYGPQAETSSQDELREALDHLRLILVSAAEAPLPGEEKLPKEEQDRLMNERIEKANRYVKDLEKLLGVSKQDRAAVKIVQLLIIMFGVGLAEAKNLVDVEGVLGARQK